MESLIRVVIADHSAVIRRFLTDCLNSDPEVEVVGTARDGQEAVAAYRAHAPDVILLDVEMPFTNGVDAVQRIRELDDRVPIIMFTSTTVKSGTLTQEALQSGANDYISKPPKFGSFQDALNTIQQTVVPRIKAWGRREAAPLEPVSPVA